jgi:hypothetical protein
MIIIRVRVIRVLVTSPGGHHDPIMMIRVGHGIPSLTVGRVLPVSDSRADDSGGPSDSERVSSRPGAKSSWHYPSPTDGDGPRRDSGTVTVTASQG